MIVGFPAEDDAAFERTLETVRAARLTKVTSFRTHLARDADRGRRPGAAGVKKERSARLRALSDDACRARSAEKVGRDDVVLVDRPGRGYGANFTRPGSSTSRSASWCPRFPPAAVADERILAA